MYDNIDVIHASVAGRLRVKIPQLTNHAMLAQRLEQELVADDVITSAQANSLTATVLVNYPPARPTQSIINRITNALSRARNPRPPVPITVWWCLTERQVFSQLNATPHGLSTDEADERRRVLGPNLPYQIEAESRWMLLWRQINSLPIMLLCASATFSVITGGLLDAGLVSFVVAANVTIGYRTENTAESVIRAFMKHERPIAIVRRDGRPQEIASENLVPGDIILVSPGSILTTDARVLVSNELTVDESLLTGESVPVLKTPQSLSNPLLPIGDRQNMLFSGTVVASGTGIAIIVATGTATEMSRIAAVVAATEQTDTPMQRQLHYLGRQLTVASVLSSIAILGLGFLRGASPFGLIRTATALAVAAIPEGLPAVATSILATGLREMQQHNVLIRRLAAVETLGCVSVLCFDKTGTLTQNKMAAMTVVTNRERFAVLNDFSLSDREIEPTDYPTLMQLLHVATLCNEADVTTGRDTKTINGSATENALLLLAARAGIDIHALRTKHPILLLNLRSGRRRYMKTVHAIDNVYAFVAVKGDPLNVLNMCDRYMDNNALYSLDHELRRAIAAENDAMMAHGLRVLGFACDRKRDDAESGLIWLGMVGLTDPARPGIRVLIEEFHQAGIRTVMLTGDQSGTARAIADEVGLAPDIRLLDGPMFNELSPAELEQTIPQIDVFSRVSPIHKLDIVQALRDANEVVAMTGDGTNDGPALRAADIGVAMGMNGTDAAREVADVVLAEDDLTTMIVAIRQGRTIYSNIRKAVHFLVGTNSSEVLLMLTAAAANVGQPLNPAQLLWLNLVTDVAIGFSLGFEPPAADVLTQPPRPINEKIINPQDYRRLLTKAALFSGSAMLTHLYGMGRYGTGGGGIAFATLVAAQLLDGYSSRSETIAAWNLPPNAILHRSILGLLGVQAAATLWPVSRSLLGIAPLDLLDLAVIGLGAGVPFLATETFKRGDMISH